MLFPSLRLKKMKPIIYKLLVMDSFWILNNKSSYPVKAFGVPPEQNSMFIRNYPKSSVSILNKSVIVILYQERNNLFVWCISCFLSSSLILEHLHFKNLTMFQFLIYILIPEYNESQQKWHHQERKLREIKTKLLDVTNHSRQT